MIPRFGMWYIYTPHWSPGHARGATSEFGSPGGCGATWGELR